MRIRMAAVALLAVLAVGVLSAQTVRDVPRISIDDVKQLMATKQVVLIDVRDPRSFADGHIPGAINVPMASVQSYLDTIPKDKPVVAYCT